MCYHVKCVQVPGPVGSKLYVLARAESSRDMQLLRPYPISSCPTCICRELTSLPFVFPRSLTHKLRVEQACIRCPQREKKTDYACHDNYWEGIIERARLRDTHVS